MDLPTYTNIWRIEKRLYKIYDFRLPIPLPIGQIVVFVAITVPYVMVLTLVGLPFDHSLFWLYILPPGVATWLATRPVLENKRLPELLGSQIRYLAEPRMWCRMMPTGEPDEIVIVGRVWHRGAADVDAQGEACRGHGDGSARDKPGHGSPGHGSPGHGSPGHGSPGHGSPGHRWQGRAVAGITRAIETCP